MESLNNPNNYARRYTSTGTDFVCQLCGCAVILPNIHDDNCAWKLKREFADEIVKVYGVLEEWGKRRDASANHREIPLYAVGDPYTQRGLVSFSEREYEKTLMDALVRGVNFSILAPIELEDGVSTVSRIVLIPQEDKEATDGGA